MKHLFQKQKKTSVLLTRIRYGCIWIAVCIFHLFYQSYLTHYLFLLTSLLPFVTLILMLIQKNRLTLEVQFSQKEIIRGRKGEVSIKVISKMFPIAILKFDCKIENVFYGTSQIYELALISGNGTRFQETIPSEQSGLRKATIQDYLLIDLLGLWRVKQSCQTQATMLVLPPYQQSSQIEQFCEQGMEKEKEIARKTGLQSSDSYEIRDYQEGDSLKRLHHKMTYKLQKPMIRQYANLEAAQVMLILDLSGEVEMVEKTLTMFHSVARAFVNKAVSITCVYEQQAHCHQVEITYLPQIQQVLGNLLSAPRSEAFVSVKNHDDIQYRIHGNELTILERKEVVI